MSSRALRGSPAREVAQFSEVASFTCRAPTLHRALRRGREGLSKAAHKRFAPMGRAVASSAMSGRSFIRELGRDRGFLELVQ